MTRHTVDDLESGVIRSKPHSKPQSKRAKSSQSLAMGLAIAEARPLGYAAGMLSPIDTLAQLTERASASAPLDLVQLERAGVRGRLIKELAKALDVPNGRLFAILGVPKATAERVAANNGVIAGAGGQAVLGIVRLLGLAQGIVDNSTAEAAQGFDTAKWLGHWIERPQPSLGGLKPADLLDTPTGFELVRRTLGAIESGVYL